MKHFMKHFRFVAAALLCFCGSNLIAVNSLRAADQSSVPESVSDWMALTATHRVDLFHRTLETSRTDAMVALAMFEAANAIERNYVSQLGIDPIDGTMEPDAAVAVASAAVHTLLDLYPAGAQAFRDAYQRSIAERRTGPGFKIAEQLGVDAAKAALARGRAMNDSRVAPYRATTPPGEYIPEGTPSLITDFDLALLPWALESSDAARPVAPPELNTRRYASNLLEVQRLGAKLNHTRTSDQTESARFWFLIDMNPVLRRIAERPGRTLSQNARLYAMFYMASDDAWIAASDAKSHYQFWRPVTAIRSADRDGNESTVRDAYWEPLMPTPPHPEYPCAHCLQAAAQATVLDAELGDAELLLTFMSSTLPNAEPRSVTTAQYVAQTSMSRIYAGAHYRFSNEAGEASGRVVGRAVLRCFRPNARIPAVATR
ncbi:MAG: vanadium-dependent haloperoxidase [Pseudomonadota bacterium]